MAILGRTKIEAFPLGLGGIPLIYMTWKEAEEIIETCIDQGVNFADTAEGYGDSEEKLSMALRRDREAFSIATKSTERTARGMATMIDKSLRRLKTDYIDLYQIHAIGSSKDLHKVLGPGGALEAMKAARDAGKIRHIGVTGHQPSVLIEAIKTGEFDTVMAAINVVDRESEQVLLPLAKEMNIGVLAMKPICGGTLDTPLHGIRYCLNSPADIVLCGMKNLTEVEDNIRTTREFKPLSQQEEDDLLAAASQMGNQFCRRCGYCQPCPEGINIPRVLWLANVHARASGGHEEWTEEEYGLMQETADYCEECGQCEDICPYELPTREMLKSAHAELIPTSTTQARRKLRKALNKAKNIRKEHLRRPGK